MENDKNISSGDNFKNIVGDAKQVTQFIDDGLDRKIKMLLNTKAAPKTPVKLTKKDSKKF